ncbi:MAG: ribonuclease P protein component [Phycisphaerales bacterium]|nr:ribonuclease P protein component [Phycisphaerales bacterium]MDP7088094.1 ribonuclease P protein component [Phycisphaerales bacterium]MDP7189297.1 ribonuclease P protein component [Phycisphaerales bacterium]MDP7574487.1 ribonuclease P protein component [Phycisphaerales bacterium]HCA39968.1 ribonuclease P protein component [Phycisphaerales bacterium]
MTRHRPGRAGRIRRSSEFRAVFESGLANTSGPLRLHAMKSTHDRSRLGLAVSRRVGNAVRRNRIKRLLRVAFRMACDGWNPPLDVVIVVLPHDPKSLDDYSEHIEKAARNSFASGALR